MNKVILKPEVFYGKAIIEEDNECVILRSFGRKLCVIENNKVRICKKDITRTEESHIREFLREHCFECGLNRTQLLAKYS